MGSKGKQATTRRRYRQLHWHLDNIQTLLQRKEDEQRASIVQAGKKKPEEIARVEVPGFTFEDMAQKSKALRKQETPTLKVSDLDWAEMAHARLAKYFEHTEDLDTLVQKITKRQNAFANIALNHFTPPGFSETGSVVSVPGKLIPVDSPDGKKLQGKPIYSIVK